MAATASDAVPAPAGPPDDRRLARILSFRNMFALSATHSVLFTGLMLCAFVLGHPQPATFIFGFTHGVLYVVIAILAGIAARLKTVSLTTALVVIIMGAMGPYFGTYDFAREWRRRSRAATGADPVRPVQPVEPVEP